MLAGYRVGAKHPGMLGRERDVRNCLPTPKLFEKAPRIPMSTFCVARRRGTIALAGGGVMQNHFPELAGRIGELNHV